MVKTYLKYEHSHSLGTVTTPSCGVIWTAEEEIADQSSRKTGAGRAFCAANEDVLCWDIKKGELLSTWHANDCRAQITALAQSKADPDVIAAGYGDGSIRVWDARLGTIIVSFNGHRSAVTILVFDSQGVRLASGSRDTDIIIWDLVSETGLFKLRGHKDQVTGLQFLNASSKASSLDGDAETEGVMNDGSDNSPDTFLLSTSKDALIKVWDVESQYCLETHITQSNGECWSLGVSPDLSGCITGGNDAEMQFWSLDTRRLSRYQGKLEADDDGKYLHERGTITRQGRDRTIAIDFHPKADYIAVCGAEKSVEIWRIRPQVEIEKVLARKRKRRREKLGAGKVNGDAHTEHTNDDHMEASVSDVFVPHTIVRTGGKARSFSWAGGAPTKTLQILVSTTNNLLEFFQIPVAKKAKEANNSELADYERPYAVELSGHRNDVRAIALSSDDRMLASASSGSLKIWNVNSRACLRTLDCGYALCCAFLPGDKLVLVGNKEGQLELFDIASSTLVDTIDAHEGAVWSLKVHPDGRSVVTGSADKTAKLWKFEIVQESIPGTKRTTPRFKLVHSKTLKVNDDILSVCFSPDSRLIAVSTLDNTVKVFFLDTLKLFLTLYGHKLPVLNMSISSDSKLITTCSADKNVRLWGLDFGDCHKALFAHDDSIMQVAFIPEPSSKEDGHFFFSASKDGVLKSWDGDKFEQVQRCSGHHGEIWALAVSRTGDLVVTASHDKSLRIWSQSEEPLFLEEERERDLEESYDANLTASMAKDQLDEYAAAGDQDDQVVAASKQTSDTLTAGEKITEALAMCLEDHHITEEYEKQRARNPSARLGPPQRNPLLALRNVSADEHLLSVFERIPSAALHDALLLLSYSQLSALFIFLSRWLEREMNTPLTCRILFFLLKTHHKQIVASRELRSQLQEMQGRLQQCLDNWKSLMGFNMAAVKVLGTRIGAERSKTIEDVDEDISSGTSSKKRAFVNVA